MIIKLTDKKKIQISIENARCLLLESSNEKPTEIRDTYELYGHTYNTDTIIKLNFNNLHEISIGDKLEVEGDKYTVNFIEHAGNNSYLLVDQKLNKSAKYLLPLIFDTGVYAKNRRVFSSLYNCYTKSSKHPKFVDDNYLFLKYRFQEDENYKKLESELVNQVNFILLDDSDNRFVTFVFEISAKYDKDIDNFWGGLYHNFKPATQNHILSFFNPTCNGSKYRFIFEEVMSILHRSKTRIKSLETKLGVDLPNNIGLDSKPIIKNETLML